MKQNIIIISISIIVFLLFNLFGTAVIGRAGQTTLEVVIGYAYYALWGLIFGIILIFVDRVMGRKK